jgi:3-oxoacyl-[acyl-carrier protein] reductase
MTVDSSFGIEGMRAAVAASSTGLGFACAAALVDAGVRVAVCGRDRQRIDAAAERLGPLATPLVTDVATATGAADFVTRAVDALGGIDILVANGGGPPPATFATATTGQYADAFEQNCLSAIAMCGVAVPHMRAAGWGRIVAVTSIAVRQPIPELILSNTARAGLTGFCKTLAREVAPDGVTVNTVQPGLHATDRLLALHGDADSLAASIPVGRVGDPADFGRVVAFLCSQHAGFITGAAIPVDGGAYAGLL